MSTQPFDPIASDYDSSFTHSAVGQLQRQQVYFFLEKILPQLKGKKILELNCGTGEDALWLAQKGYQVLATDISMGMVEHSRQKIKAEGFHQEVEVQQMAIEAIVDLPTTDRYDLIFSNFGGFNCLDATTLCNLAQPLADRLVDGGHFVAVVMGRICLWESLYYLAKLSPRQAFRRLGKEPLSVDLGNDKSIDTWYYRPAEFYQLLANSFQQQQIFPIGFTLPPSYLDPAFQRRPKLLRSLHRLEQRSHTWRVAYNMADHFFIHLQKKDLL